MDNVDVEHTYGPEIVISPNTNRPFVDPKKNPLIFWCDTCHLKLTTVRSAIQHLTGRPHKAKLNDPTKEGKQDLKRKNVKPSIQEPDAKKLKEQATKPATKKKEQAGKELDLKCDDCNRVFVSPIIAIQHFKGKKHSAMIASKLAAKQSQRGQRGGRGQSGSGGIGRGNVFGRGGNALTRGGITNFGRFGGGGYAAGELITALQNFCGGAVNNFRNPSVPLSSYNNQTTTPKSNFNKGGGNYYNNSYHSNTYPTKNSYQMDSDAVYDSFYK